MKPWMVWSVLGLLVCASVGGASGIWSTGKAGRIDGERLAQAVRMYVREEGRQGRTIPEMVSVVDLIRRGHLAEEDVSWFTGMDLRMGLRADETRPVSVVAEVTMPDGTQAVVLGDGSVQCVGRVGWGTRAVGR